MKCGTSWIQSCLESRSDVCLPRGVKETFYFDRHYRRRQLDWYAEHFRLAGPDQTILEIAPTYFHAAGIVDRVAEALGPIPIVITLRDPVARAFSLYRHMRRYGMTRRATFGEALIHHPEIIESSRYATHLRRWQDRFGTSRVRVVWMETLRRDPFAFANQVCSALDIARPTDPDALPGRINEATIPRHHAVATAGRWAGDLLRRHRLYRPIEIAKSLGIKPLFFGTAEPSPIRQSPPSATESEIERFRNLLGNEWPQIESLKPPIDAAA